MRASYMQGSLDATLDVVNEPTELATLIVEKIPVYVHVCVRARMRVRANVGFAVCVLSIWPMDHLLSLSW